MTPEQYKQILFDVNSQYNSFTYESSDIQFDAKDYWLLPREFEIKQYGDCENFAISKYFKLKSFGISTILIYCLYNKNPHLICFDCKYCLILDICDDLITYEHSSNIEFIYGFNEDYWFSLLSTMKFDRTNDALKYIFSCKLKYHSIDILTLWNELLFRMKLEKFNESN